MPEPSAPTAPAAPAAPPGPISPPGGASIPAFSNTGRILRGVTDSVMQRFRTQEPPPGATITAASSFEQDAQAPPAADLPEQPQPPSAPESPPVESFAWEGDYAGAPLKLPKGDVDFLIPFALDALAQANEKMREPQQGAAPQDQPPAAEDTGDIPPEALKVLERYTKPLRDELNKLKQEGETTRKSLQAKEAREAFTTMQKEMRELFGKHELAELAKGADAQELQLLQDFAMWRKLNNPNMSLQGAAKTVFGAFAALIKGKQTAYVADKVKQAKTKVEGKGGSSPAPGAKKLDRNSFKDGTLKSRIANRVAAALMEGR